MCAVPGVLREVALASCGLGQCTYVVEMGSLTTGVGCGSGTGIWEAIQCDRCNSSEGGRTFTWPCCAQVPRNHMCFCWLQPAAEAAGRLGRQLLMSPSLTELAFRGGPWER
eukprot:11004244-Alexandrium_andersonii.AAC.1